jgi:hypothetical protein
MLVFSALLYTKTTLGGDVQETPQAALRPRAPRPAKAPTLRRIKQASSARHCAVRLVLTTVGAAAAAHAARQGPPPPARPAAVAAPPPGTPSRRRVCSCTGPACGRNRARRLDAAGGFAAPCMPRSTRMPRARSRANPPRSGPTTRTRRSRAAGGTSRPGLTRPAPAGAAWRSCLAEVMPKRPRRHRSGVARDTCAPATTARRLATSWRGPGMETQPSGGQSLGRTASWLRPQPARWRWAVRLWPTAAGAEPRGAAGLQRRAHRWARLFRMHG